MKYSYPYLLFFAFFAVLSLAGCSGNSDPQTFEGEPNSTAIETCYDVQLTNAGSIQNKTICTTRENGGFNGLGTARFMRFTVDAFSTVSIQVTRLSGLNPADPDILLYRSGIEIGRADTTIYNNEILTQNLNAGNYVAVINEFEYFKNDEKQNNSFPVQQKTQVYNNVSQATSPSNCATGDDSFVSGNVSFARVNHLGSALNYSDITYPPVQEAVVEVICNGGAYSSGVTDANGFYRLNFPNSQSSFVRVKAQMLNADNWDFSVVNNDFTSQPIYAMDSSVFTVSTDTAQDLVALSGWGFPGYTGERVAAPFAILDSVRKAKDRILNVANVKFPPLKINWSTENSSSNPGTFYDGTEIFLAGKENNDTDEYDEHVIIHEWAHYFEDNFSRSDSIGGIHGTGDILDMRVAFGEGFGNAFSAIVMDDPLYVDSSGIRQGNGFSIDMENNCTRLFDVKGWYSECSVQSIIYDLYDINNDGADTLNLNFSFIYNVLVGEQRSTQALTSIFSFIKPLKDQNPASANAIDLILNSQDIDSVSDIYGSSQISINPGQTDQLPIYEVY